MVIKLSKNLKYYVLAWLAFALVFALLIYMVASKNSSYLRSSGSSVSAGRTVIIDAGHGGEDGGATARDGTMEKGINLSISLKLRDMLTAAGFNVIMTRETDVAIYSDEAKTMRQKKISDIHNRMKIIEENSDALFVSIHQNHFESSKYFGTQVFYSKNNPESAVAAEKIQQSVVRLIQPDNTRAVKKTGTEIYLLYHAKSPAVMVECGFLSNETETQKLKSEEYQSKMAFAVMCGIIDYLSNSAEGSIDGRKSENALYMQPVRIREREMVRLLPRVRRVEYDE